MISTVFFNFILSSLSVGDWTGIIGLILSTFLTIYGYVDFKKSKFIFVLMDSSFVYVESKNKERRIKISIENSPIEKNLFYIKGIVVFMGEKDYEKKSVEIPFTIESVSPSGWWYSFKILKSNFKFDPCIRINRNKLELSNELVKNSDYFEFESYLEAPQRTVIAYSRILNVKGVAKAYDLAEYKSAKKNIFGWLFCLFIGIFFLKIVNFTQDSIYKTYTETVYYKGKKVDKDSLYSIALHERKTIFDDIENPRDSLDSFTNKLRKENQFKRGRLYKVNSKLEVEYLLNIDWWYIFSIFLYIICFFGLIITMIIIYLLTMTIVKIRKALKFTK